MSSDIKTFIFFDIEGTGLPQFNGSTKIMEISFVACSVDHFVESSGQNMPEIPRVLHKLSFCVNPYKRICEESSKITGLDNFKLEHESKLGVRELEMITKFVERLQQPACLVAHNGNGYDYPLLRKEFLKQKIDVPEGLLCVDSLEIFRKIDQARDREREEDEELAEFIRNELREIEKAERDAKNMEENSKMPPETLQTKEQVKEPSEPLNHTEYDVLCPLSSAKEFQRTNETTPKRLTMPNTTPRIGRTRRSPQETPEKSTADHIPKSRKQLFPAKRKYRLVDIYRRFFGVDPEDSHHAECDAYILMRCALREARDFLAVSQTYSKPFTDVPIDKCIY